MSESQQQLSVDDAYILAIEHFNAERYTEADQLCTAIIKAVPNHIDAINLLAVIAQKFNRHDLAVDLFKRAISIDRNRALLYYNLGASLYALGQREEALNVLQTAKQKEPENRQIDDFINTILNVEVDNIEEILQQGISYHQSGQLVDAINSYKKVLEIQPENVVAHANIGAALESLGELDDAVVSYKKAIAIKPDYPQAYFNLGNTLNNQGKLDDAVDSYEKAISIKPDYADSYANLAHTLKKQGRLDDAVASFQKVITIKPDSVDSYYSIGTIFKEQNRLDDAVGNLEKTIELNPEHIEAYNKLGAVLKDQNRVDEAMSCLNKAIAIKADHANSHCNLGIILKEQGKLDEALISFKKAVAIKKDYAQAYSNIGVTLHEQAKFDEALANLKNAIAIKPDYADAYSNIGLTLHEQGKLDEAVASFQKAITIKADHADAYYNLGITLQEQNKFAEAVSCYQQAIEIRPDHAKAHNNLGNTLKELWQLDEAVSCYEKAISITPDYAEAFSNLGAVLQDLGRVTEGVASHHKAIEINPNSAQAYSNLGLALQEQGRLDAAINSFHKAISIKSDFADAHAGIAGVLRDQGRLNEAVNSYQKAIAIKPDRPDYYSRFLFLISYYCLFSDREILEHHKHWDKVHGSHDLRNGFRHPVETQPNKKLKIGYISPDFKRHAVSNFLRGVIKNHDRNNFKIYCYANVSTPDAITAEFKASADVWRDTLVLSDMVLAQQIYDDGVDILIDLSGHTKGHRLKLFTYKPAPVQTTYLGYCTTTGLHAMDYWLTDHQLTPENSQEITVETVVRLPDCWVSYQPTNPPPIALMDRGPNVEVVFGSFNHLSKITETVVAVWSRILSAIPASKLFLKANNFVDPLEQERISLMFAKQGISTERLILEKNSATYLQEYGLIDIALDPFPRTGGATTADALWMGVPVITLAGQRMIERQGVSLLTAVGKKEWIAQTVDEYVIKALELAEEGVRDSTQRLSLHNMVTNSPLCDYQGFVAALEAAYRQMWLLKSSH
ncbi:MAG: tetratricopeptide repeat protein [Magnetococcales bacterium]|nr:tetratricopeptide repeat protein [Magnetococcales bacterium]